ARGGEGDLPRQPRGPRPGPRAAHARRRAARVLIRLCPGGEIGLRLDPASCRSFEEDSVRTRDDAPTRARGPVMTFSGDLASIDLADLLQNIETHDRTGTLTLKSDTGASRIFVRQGKIAMFAADNRPPLGDMLVAAGFISAKKMDAARRKQRGSRKTLAETLIGAKFITDRDLHAAAQDFLSEDVANLVASAAGEFQFQQGEDLPEGFDADEQWCELSLP